MNFTKIKYLFTFRTEGFYNTEQNNKDRIISIIYFMGSQVGIPVILCKQCRPEEMPHPVAFHLGLHCLPLCKFQI